MKMNEKIDNDNRNFFMRMVFPDGTISQCIALSKNITLNAEDPVLNIAAERIGMHSKGIMVVFGFGQTVAFNYENGKIEKLVELA